jgi:predicted enzyme related to lactoylglutathione lyase
LIHLPVSGAQNEDETLQKLEKIDESEYGKFAWVIDPEGNKVQLWEPPPGQ